MLQEITFHYVSDMARNSSIFPTVLLHVLEALSEVVYCD